MLSREYIYDEGVMPSCHASTLVVIGDEVLAAWFGGTREGAPDVAIWFARRTGKGAAGKWSAPVKVAAGEGVPTWNPVLHQPRSGPLLLFYKVGPSPQTWTGALLRSKDAGATWSPPELLPAGILGPIKNKALELPNGTLVCGSSVESYQVWGCWVERTPDQGATWTKHGPINVAGHLYGIIQPAVFGTPEGHLAMLCRARGLDRMVRAESRDGGVTWTQATPVDLPQNNSGLDAVRLTDGRVVVIYNHTTRGRTPLNLAVSGDMGKTWKPGPVLETELGEYSYPAILQAQDGRVHFTYTWNRKKIRYGVLEPSDLPKT